MHFPSRILFFALFILPVTLQGQSRQDEKQKKKKEKDEVSPLELRLRLTDFYIRFTEVIELNADKIYFKADDYKVRKAALMWKIYGISAMNKAVNMPDPVASFFNAWPFAKQMVTFFESGIGKETLGVHHQIALDASIDLENRLRQIIHEIAEEEDYDKANKIIEEWADNHPITDFYFSRESTLEFFAKRLGQERFGLGKSISTITSQVIELSNKINLYTDQIPRQARWQADLAIMNYLHDSSGALSRVDHVIENMDKITNFVEGTPEMLEYNREATLMNIDKQRKKSLQLIINERKAVISEIRQERIAVINTIIEERKSVIEEIKNERVAILKEIDLMADDKIQKTGVEIERIVDMIFWRSLIIMAIVGVVLLSAFYIYKRV